MHRIDLYFKPFHKMISLLFCLYIGYNLYFIRLYLHISSIERTSKYIALQMPGVYVCRSGFNAYEIL